MTKRIVRAFIVKEHPEYGGLGFQPKWMPMADPLGGLAVAHDCLEHRPKDDGSVEHELLALGAALYTRWECGIYDNPYRRGGYGETIRSEWLMQLDYLKARGYAECFWLRDPPGGRRRLEDPYPEEQLQDAGSLGKLLEFIKGERGADDPYWIEPFTADRAFMAKAVRWLRLGYRYARRRYRDYDQYTLGCLFKRLQEEADRKLKHAEEGMELVVRIGLDQMDYRLSLEFPDDPDWA